jgi:hypothetical protein
MIIINEPIKKYTDYFVFSLQPCEQAYHDSRNDSITCESEESFLNFMEEEDASVSFFWFD